MTYTGEKKRQYDKQWLEEHPNYRIEWDNKNRKSINNGITLCHWCHMEAHHG